MRVRCTATADYRSNAVGNLELECTDAGLCIALRGVSSYREGYAPGPPVHASAVCVPWQDVYATRIGEASLLLSVDARRLPLNRLRLGQFSDPPLPPSPGLSPARRLVLVGSLGAGLLAVGVALGLASALPQPRVLGTFAMAAALALGVMTWIVARARRAPERSPEEVLRELSLELARRLPNHVAVELPTPEPRAFDPVDLTALLPRSAVGIAITLAATTLAALIGSSAARPSSGAAAPTASSAALQPTALEADSRAPDGAFSSLAPEPAAHGSNGALEPSAAPLPEALLGGPCECQRDESLLWREPLPRLTPVIISQQRRLHDGHEHTELELALVNDGADATERVSLSVLFFEQRAGEHAGYWQTGERLLNSEGPLAPGGMARWHVEGRGTSFDLVGPDLGTLAPNASDAAPAHAFTSLAAEGPRALRLHAALLLAFRGDEEAEAAALALRPTATPAEAAYLERIASTPHDVAACQIAVTRESSGRWRLGACLFNRASQPRGDLWVRLLALDEPLDAAQPGARAPRVLAQHTAHLASALAPSSGRTLALSAPLPIEPGVVPRAFEVSVDREENLP
jgi:hypothetical protein